MQQHFIGEVGGLIIFDIEFLRGGGRFFAFWYTLYYVVLFTIWLFVAIIHTCCLSYRGVILTLLRAYMYSSVLLTVNIYLLVAFNCCGRLTGERNENGISKEGGLECRMIAALRFDSRTNIALTVQACTPAYWHWHCTQYAWRIVGTLGLLCTYTECRFSEIRRLLL